MTAERPPICPGNRDEYIRRAMRAVTDSGIELLGADAPLAMVLPETVADFEHILHELAHASIMYMDLEALLKIGRFSNLNMSHFIDIRCNEYYNAEPDEDPLPPDMRRHLMINDEINACAIALCTLREFGIDVAPAMSVVAELVKDSAGIEDEYSSRLVPRFAHETAAQHIERVLQWRISRERIVPNELKMAQNRVLDVLWKEGA